jgi:hypothetical protein
MMGTRVELTEKFHALEKRLDDLEARFRGLSKISLTLGAALEELAVRGLLPRELMDRFNQALEPQRDRFGPYADEALQELAYSLLDGLMESLDEGKMAQG